ncbi:amidase [Candidatus Uabimicrobium amorphum]|uniref:Amidase n=2 Tax=Uabimicrobium amorphum TaxID=2596890 RepID=A0A5S9ITX7_UABAM|nr:amidase [Candidatus Uabimicrobium amorphum]BBM86535.1 amidase [Candidatus Uabimicrobium amorphum]
MKEFANYDALGLADLVKRKEVTPLELVEESIRRIEETNPKLNAVIIRMFDHAREMAQKPVSDGVFAGVPFLIKDLVSTYKGFPFTRGCKGLKNYIAPEDSELMKRYKATGVIVVGKTNTPEFGLMGVTEPEAYGPTVTPWNVQHTSGGSSGGSASSIAAGFVPMASGGDGGGSLRIPASCCGLFGLKPSRGRTPTGPKGEHWQGAAVEHIITRSVRDSAAMLDATNGGDIGSPYIIQPPTRKYMEEITTDPGKLRIAFSTQSPVGGDVHPECIQAVNNAAKLLSELGHDVEEKTPDYDGLELATSYLTMVFGETAVEIDHLKSMLGRKATRKDVEAVTWTLALLGRSFSAYEFAKAKRNWNTFSRAMQCFHQTYDVYLTPTIATPPPKVGETAPRLLEILGIKVVNLLGLGKTLKASGIVDKMAKQMLEKFPFTQLANLTGQPAMSVPLHWTAEGLPCGVQFVAPLGDEATLFRLAAQLEKAQPWFEKTPVI